MSTVKTLNALKWDAEAGIGYLPVTEAPYDADYWAKYERYAASPMGQELNRVRQALVQRHAGNDASVIDVGIGCGDFVKRRPGPTFGFDVNPVGVRWLKDRRLWRDPNEQPADALTFWDVIEHIPDPAAMLANARRFVFASLPIWPGPGAPGDGWKHFRRDEHCWYFTRGGFLRWMAEYGFACVDWGTWETEAGREDIETFAFRRIETVRAAA